MDAIFLLFIILNVFGDLATCSFSMTVTSRSFFFVHGHFIIAFLILHVVVHSSHHAFDLGQLGLYPFWQVVIVAQDLFQGLCMTHHSLDAVFGHFTFAIVFAGVMRFNHVFHTVFFNAATFVFVGLACHTLWTFVSALWTSGFAFFACGLLICLVIMTACGFNTSGSSLNVVTCATLDITNFWTHAFFNVTDHVIKAFISHLLVAFTCASNLVSVCDFICRRCKFSK